MARRKTTKCDGGFLTTMEYKETQSVNLWNTVEFDLAAAGIRDETKKALERKTQNSFVLASAPESRNGCKPVLKKRKKGWEG